MTYRLLLPMLLAACAFAPDTALAQDAAAIAPPPPDKARIIFVRLKQGLGRDSDADVLQIVDGKPQYLARLNRGDMLVVDTAPGKKEFMTTGYTPQKLGGATMAGDLLFADVEAGQVYAVMLRFHYGTGGFIPEPVRADRRYHADSRKVLQAIANGHEVHPSPEELRRVSPDRNGQRVQKEFERMTGAYQKKGPDRLKERTLRPEDTVK